MTNEKLYTVTIIYTCKSTTYSHVRNVCNSSFVFTGYNGLKSALNIITKNYIGERDNYFYTVSHVRVSETLILR